MIKKYFKKIGVSLTIAMLVVTMLPATAMAKTEPNNPDNWQWYKYANSVTNNSITKMQTPSDANESALKWAAKLGEGWSASPTPPLIDDKYIYVAAGSTVRQLDKATGEETELSKKEREPFHQDGTVEYAMNPMLYAEGMLFVPIKNGRIQAVDAKTLKPIWCSEPLGGQCVSNLSYGKLNGKGYVFSGTWNGESSDGDFFAVAIDEEGISEEINTVTMQPSQEKKPIVQKVKKIAWKFTPSKDDRATSPEYNRPRGFYWSGAYVTDKYLAVGTDDGFSEGQYNPGSSLYTLNPRTGEIIDKIVGIKGDIRTSVSYDNGHLYFSTKGGHLHKCDVDENGKLSNDSHIALERMTTATPVVYKDRIYIGYSGTSQFDPSSGHMFAVISNKGSLSQDSLVYKQAVPGYPQATPLVSTAYENEDFDNDGKADGRVYVYFTYNAPPGGIFFFYDTPKATAPAFSDSECALYTPEGNTTQYGLSPVSTDNEGVLYFKNDSGNLFAVEKNLAYLSNLDIKADEGTLTMDEGFELPGNFSPKKHLYTGKINECKTLKVTPEVVSGGTVTVNGKPFTGTPIEVTADDIEPTVIRIVAKKGTYQRIYKVELTPKGSSAKLYDLKLTGQGNTPPWAPGSDNPPKVLTPAFDKEIKEYVSVVDEQIRGSHGKNLWITPEDGDAKIDVYPVDNVSEKSTFNEDGETLKLHKSNFDNDGKLSYRLFVKEKASKRDVKYRIEVTSENGNHKESYVITVGLQYHAADVQLNKRDLILDVGQSFTLEANVFPDNADVKDVTWSTESKAIELGSDGKVKAIKEGSADVVVRSVDGGKTDNCKVKVIDSKLDKARSDAINELKNAYNLEDYFEEEQNQIKEIVKSAEKAFKKAATVEEVNQALAKAKASISKLKTKAEYAADELTLYKKTAKNELKSYYNIENYREKEANELNQIVSEAETNIDSAANKEAVDKAVKEAKAKIDKLKTKAQYEEEEAMELKDLKAKLKKELGELKDPDDYREAEKKALAAAVKKGQESIENATNKAEAQSEFAKAKAEIDNIKTDAQLKELEKKAAKAVDDKISSIKKPITVESKNAIDEARAAYDNLTEKEKAFVTKLSELEAAEKAYEEALKVHELNKVKESLKKQLETYKDPDLYREAERKKLAEAVNQGKGEIEKAEDAVAANKAFETAKKAIDALNLKTAAEYDKEELDEAKTLAKKEISDYKKADEYREAEKVKLGEIIKSGHDAVEASKDKDEVANAVTAAKAEMDKLKTDAQLKIEAQRAAEAVQILIADATKTPVLFDSSDSIKMARDAFNRLSDEAKAIVENAAENNLNHLVKAETDLIKASKILKFITTSENNSANKEITIKGDNAYFIEKKGKGLVYELNTDFKNFDGVGKVTVDGKELELGKDYSAKAGSVIIAFNESFLNGLEVGNHVVRIMTTEGYGEVAINVQKEAASNTDNSKPSVDKSSSKSAKTGDSNDALSFVLISIIAAAAILLITKYVKK